MRWSTRLLLLIAVLVHGGMLLGWRWQNPLVPYFFDATVLSGGRGLDFYSIYQAGYNARQGADIYEGDPARIDVVVPYFTPYRYLPSVAYTVGAALSLFSPLTAYKIWVVVIELTLLLCVIITWRKVHRQHGADLAARLTAMWLAFTPFYLELFMGQFSLVQAALVFGMLVFSVDAPKAAKPHLNPAVGWLWLISILWKINTLIFAPVFVRWRRWRILILTALTIGLTTLPYFVIFPAHGRDFLLNNFGNSVAGHELGNLGFRQLVFELLAPYGASPMVQRGAQMMVIALVLGLALRLTFWPSPPQAQSTSPNTRSLNLESWNLNLGVWNLNLWLTAFFLVSPQIWEHHYVMLLPVLVVSYWQKPHWALALIWLGLALPTPFGFIGLQPVIAANHDLRAFALEPAWQPLLQHASKAAPTLGLFIYLAYRLENAKRQREI